MTQIDGEIYHVYDQKNKYNENEYTTQSNLQIQCNPYKTANDIIDRTTISQFVWKYKKP